jgi:hypothetical protein
MMTAGISPKKQGSTGHLCIEDGLEELMKEQQKQNEKLRLGLKRLLKKFEEWQPWQEEDEPLVNLTETKGSRIQPKPLFAPQVTYTDSLNSKVGYDRAFLQPKYRLETRWVRDRRWNNYDQDYRRKRVCRSKLPVVSGNELDGEIVGAEKFGRFNKEMEETSKKDRVLELAGLDHGHLAEIKGTREIIFGSGHLISGSGLRKTLSHCY